MAACPRKAIYKRPEDGIVLIDQNRCRGYKKCVEQCPYKKPMYRGTTRVSEKCSACYPRIEGKDPLTGGEPVETRCVAAARRQEGNQAPANVPTGAHEQDPHTASMRSIRGQTAGPQTYVRRAPKKNGQASSDLAPRRKGMKGSPPAM